MMQDDAGFSVIPVNNFKYHIDIIKENNLLTKCKELLPQCSDLFYVVGYSDILLNHENLNKCKNILPECSKFFFL